MRDEFEKLVTLEKIGAKHVEALVVLQSAGFCHHKSWGVGRITGIDSVLARFNIDFQGKPGHTMDLTFAAESLKPIPSEHIFARKLTDLPALKQLAAKDHRELVRLVLTSFGGKATADQVQQALVPDVIREDWKKWWDEAKREMKKDGRFQIPAKKTEPVTFQEQEITVDARLLGEFRAARGLKAKLVVAADALKFHAELKDKLAVGKEIITSLNVDIGSHQKNQPALALEGIFLREELRGLCGLPPQADEISEAAIWESGGKAVSLLEQIAGAKQKRALQSFKATYPETWSQDLLRFLNTTSTKLAGECAGLLIEEGFLQALKDNLARWISQHQASSELMLWLARERSDSFADILGPEVFRAMLTAMERDQFNEKRSNKLRDFIMDDHGLLVELIGSADLEVIKDLTRALQLSPVFDDMDKRSLLARIVKTYPAVQSLITGDSAKQDASLLVSWDSLERRRTEYADLVNKTIPANSKEIAIARSYGDLRENHEYKAAKEMQKILMKRKSELETQLVRARGIDFGTAKTDQVNIGTIVKITDTTNNASETYTVLGAWDSEPEKNVIAYLAPVAQAMLNHKVGELVELDLGSGKRSYRIDSIEAYHPAVAA